MTTAITGANGHLGGNLARRFLADGEAVRAVVHRNRDALQGLSVEEVQGSIHEPNSLRKAFEGADTVIHSAAKISIIGDKDGSVRAANVAGARNAANAALDAGVKRFIHISSVHAFDLRSGGPISETSPRAGPNNYAYDHSKFLGEQEVRKVMDKGLDAVIVNPTGVIGPYDFAPSRMGTVFLDLARRKLPALVAGTFDFVDARDVADGVAAAATKGTSGDNYLLGGHHTSVADLAKVAQRTTGIPAPKLHLPLAAAYLGLPFAALAARFSGTQPTFTRESLGALKHGVPVDCSKARKQLGYAPRLLDESVADIYDWFRNNGDLPA